MFSSQLHKGFLLFVSLPIQHTVLPKKNTFSSSSLPWIPFPDFRTTSAIFVANETVRVGNKIQEYLNPIDEAKSCSSTASCWVLFLQV